MTETDHSRSTDHDTPWKLALESYFQEFLALLFPQIYQEVDWPQGYRFLDKELQQVTPDANSGRSTADKLIEVRALDRQETWVLIHVEVQGEPEAAFAERMYRYQYRLRDRYAVDVVSLAVLADTRERFRPGAFRYQRWGCALTFHFPSAKLIDCECRWAELENSDNVFALVVMAQIKAKHVKDGATRKDVKIALIRLLYERGYSREQVLQLFNIIDWVLELPKAREPDFKQAVYDIEEEKQMPYVNTIERLGIEKGRQEGEHKAVESVLRRLIVLKFGDLPAWADERIAAATDAQLEHWVENILTAESLEELL